MSYSTNVADGDAHVGLQVGVLHGNAYVYQTPESAPPEQKLRVAVNYLQGGSPREAERRIHALVFEDRLRSAELAYYRVLSVLSGRSLTSLSSNDMNLLDEAFAMAHEFPSGRWWRCVDTIRMLVHALLDVGPDGQPEARALGEALDAYGALTDDDREDVERHLSLTLSGVAQDHIEAPLARRHARRLPPVSPAPCASWKRSPPTAGTGSCWNAGACTTGSHDSSGWRPQPRTRSSGAPDGDGIEPVLSCSPGPVDP